MDISVKDLTHRLLDHAHKAGAEAADTLAIRGTAVSVDVRQGVLEQAERAESIDIGLRVLIGQRQAVVSVSDTSPETFEMMAERAVAMAREAPEDPYCGLADPDQFATDLDMSSLELFDASDEPAPDALQADAQTAEAASLSHEGITQVQSASATYGTHDVHFATSTGFSAGYSRSNRSISCVAIAGEGTGMEREYDYDSRIFQSDLRSADEIGHVAATRALAQIGARKPPTGTYPVLFDERIASSLISHLLGAANGSAIGRGASWLLGKEGTQILPEGLDIVEDPTRKRAGASRKFDAEGLATAQRKIIDNGVLTGFTLDLANARKLGLSSTGNAVRSVSGTPRPSNWNIELTQGSQSRDDLISSMGTGLLVTSMIGSTINPNTGDYSRGASGFWIENGEIAYPVNECTIAGNLLDMLGRIIPANDARPWLSTVVPSCLIEGMALAGE